MKIHLISLVIFGTLSMYSFVSSQENSDSKVAVKGLMVGNQVNNFTAKDHEGNGFDLYKALENGAVVLFFYRGNWCPVCNYHRSELEDNLDLIYQKGAQVVAVSPEKPELMVKTIKKTKASFTLPNDEGSRISEAFDMAYFPEKPVAKKLTFLQDNRLSESIGDESQRLPIPATHIIEKSGMISWRHFDPNIKPASAKEIVEALN